MSEALSQGAIQIEDDLVPFPADRIGPDAQGLVV
jgi:hypothetical protein